LPNIGKEATKKAEAGEKRNKDMIGQMDSGLKQPKNKNERGYPK
jgi:hypothetical protein